LHLGPGRTRGEVSLGCSARVGKELRRYEKRLRRGDCSPAPAAGRKRARRARVTGPVGRNGQGSTLEEYIQQVMQGYKHTKRLGNSVSTELNSSTSPRNHAMCVYASPSTVEAFKIDRFFMRGCRNTSVPAEARSSNGWEVGRPSVDRRRKLCLVAFLAGCGYKIQTEEGGK